ncbi:unnamed protein product [marine sediment metagenome]|uniref:Uncharacterized protein n=1 Tax=marine sediment metagenome TaxID=412755 RepID=X1R717_9ZZZZ
MDGLNEQKKGVEMLGVGSDSNDSDLDKEMQEFEKQNRENKEFLEGLK